MSKRLHVKYPLFLSDCNETWIFSTDFEKKKKAQILNLIKIRSVGAELFLANRQTAGQIRDEANSRFTQFCERA
jgi:hypothetical protein